MIGRRKTNLQIGMARLYVRKGKRTTTYFTITPDNKYVNLGHDEKKAKLKLLGLDDEAGTPGTIGDHLDDLMAERKRMVERGKLSARTVKDNATEVLELKKAFGKMRPEALRPMHVYQYLHKFRGAVAPIRANREIALLATMFNRLCSAGVLDVNPCQGVERNEEQPRDRLVTEQELVAFLDFLRKDSTEARIRIAAAAEIAYLTSKAQGQILKLHRTQLHEDGIRFTGRKRGARTLVEWTPRLRQVVTDAIAMPSRITPMYVIHNAAGQPYTTNGFQALWNRAMIEWAELGHERFTFHDIRAKSVTDMIEDGRKASDLTGHADERMIGKVYDRRRERKGKAVK